MRVAIATVQVPFIRGGAEMLAEGLLAALQASGHQAEIVQIPFKWYPAAAIPPQMLACRLLDLSESMGTAIDRVIGLKFPAYLLPHPNKVMWLLHQHRSAYDLWETPWGDLFGQPGGQQAMAAIRHADTTDIAQARRIFTISQTVSDRLRHFNGIDSQPLYHPPPLAERYHSGAPGDFLLMPSRVNGPKRQELVVEALKLTRQKVRVVFMGAPDSMDYMAAVQRNAAGLGPDRVTWLGAVPDARKVELLSTALAVIVPPLGEDYGYVTLEAMLSSRAVLTCTDSGGPLEFVEHGSTGLVSEPTPAAMADAMDSLWSNRARTRRMGEQGRARYAALGLDWATVVESLLA